jgi:hypothetical protein
MGDRCWGRLSFHHTHLDKVEKLEPDIRQMLGDEEPNSDGLLHVEEDEINYGEFWFEDDLKKAGIPYDRSSDGGAEYGPQETFFRLLPEGKHRWVVLDEGDNNVRVSTLMRLLDDHAALKAYILQSQEEIKYTPIDDEQLGLHKLWVMDQILGLKEM